MSRRNANRSRNGPDQIGELFNARDQTLEQVARSASELQPFLRAWNDVVPNPACNFLHPAYYKDGRLTVWVHSPVWANWLRHRQNLIKSRILANKLPEVLSITVQLIPENRPSFKSERYTPSPETSRQIERSARYIKDPELRKSLQRLVKSLQKSDR